MAAQSPPIAQDKRKPLRVLMCGPEPGMRGGMASMVRIYHSHWDEQAAQLRYIPSFNQGAYPAKAVLFGRAILLYIFTLLWWRPQIVHLHFSWRASSWRKLILLLLARLAAYPVLLHCHSGRFPQFYESLPRFLQKLLIVGFSQASAMLVLNQAMHDYFIAIGLRCPLILLANPVALSQTLNRPASPPQILYLGELGPHKGLMELSEAFAIVQQKYPDLRLHLAGQGTAADVAALEALVLKLGIQQQTHFLGWLDDDAKQAALAQAYLLVQPSHVEGMPIAVLEALAAGLPVIASRVGALPEMIRRAEEGLLVPPGDIAALSEAMELLLKDPARREDIAQQARLRAESAYDVRLILPQLYALYSRYGTRPR